MVLQTEIAECGVACIVMIANFYGRNTSLLSIRKYYDISLRGSNLHDLIELGRHLGLNCRGVKLNLLDIKRLETPCILHWDINHYVVLKKVYKNSVIIHDPSIGIRKYKLSEISKHFTGIALEVTQSISYKFKKEPCKIRLLDLWRGINGLKSSLFPIILITIALEIFSILTPLYIQFITDDILISQDFQLLYSMSAGFFLLIVLQGLSGYIRSWSIVRISNTLNLQLSSNLIRHLLNLPISFFERRHMGDIVSRFSSLSEIQNKISIDFVESIVDGIMAVVTLLIMFWYNKLLSTIVCSALIVYICTRIFLYSSIRIKTQESLVNSAKENSNFLESIRAIVPLKIFMKEALRENMWKNKYVDKLNALIHLSKLNLTYQLIKNFIFGFEYILIILIGAISIIEGEFSAGMLIAYIAYRQQFITKSHNLVDKVFDYKMISLHLDRVADILLTPEEKKKSYDKKISTFVIKGDIEVKNLSFKYSKNDDFIFKDISFKIDSGTSAVFVGPSGCGKTSMLKVLMGLTGYYEGAILIDGRTIASLGCSTYRSQISGVMQDDMLLSGSISENISFFDHNPDFKRIQYCASLAAIHDEILGMTMGYETLVGDMGSSLSGGQKQRILLARSIYSRPKILFLDESSSHLDKYNERIINNNLNKLNITRVIVAHRHETIKMADKIIKFDMNFNKNK